MEMAREHDHILANLKKQQAWLREKLEAGQKRRLAQLLEITKSPLRQGSPTAEDLGPLFDPPSKVAFRHRPHVEGKASPPRGYAENAETPLLHTGRRQKQSGNPRGAGNAGNSGKNPSKPAQGGEDAVLQAVTKVLAKLGVPTNKAKSTGDGAKPAPRDDQMRKPSCFFCKENGHFIRECPRRTRPPWW